jgi:hypothetical protein
MHKFQAKVNKGSLALTNRPLFNDTIACLRDGDYIMEIKEKKKKRSNSQNSYLWAVVNQMVCRRLIELGHDVDLEETHDFLKASFNYKEVVNENTGEVFKIPKGTSALSTEEFSEYIERVVRFGAEILGIIIPLPNEQMEIF